MNQPQTDDHFGPGKLFLLIALAVAILYTILAYQADLWPFEPQAVTHAPTTQPAPPIYLTPTSHPTAQIHQTPKQKASDPTIGLSYDQVMQKLDQYFKMEKVVSVNGHERYMGKTSDGYASIEIIGDKKNINSATLMFGVPDKNSESFFRVILISTLFLKNITPDWEARANWFASAINRIGESGEPERLLRGDNIILLSCLKDFGIFFLNITNKNDHS